MLSEISAILLFFVNLQFSNQKVQTNIRTKIALFEKKYDMILTEVININKNIDNIWETVNDTRNMLDIKDVEMIKTAEYISKKNLRNETLQCPRDLSYKLNTIEKGVRNEKQASRKRLNDLESKYENEVCKCHDTSTPIDRNQGEIMEMVKQIQTDQVNFRADQYKLRTGVDTLRDEITKLTDHLTENLSKMTQELIVINERLSNENNQTKNMYDQLKDEFESAQKATHVYTVSPTQKATHVSTVSPPQTATHVSTVSTAQKATHVSTVSPPQTATHVSTVSPPQTATHVSTVSPPQTTTHVSTVSRLQILYDWKRHGQSIYKGFSKGASWTNAMKTCKLESFGDGFLAEVTSNNEANFVAGLLTGEHYFWLGGCDSAKEGSWKWCGTNSRMSFTKWNVNEPNNNGEDQEPENCVSCYTEAFDAEKVGLWNDVNCNWKLSFVCEMPLIEDKYIIQTTS